MHMVNDGLLLNPDEYDEMESFIEDDEPDYQGMLSCIARIISEAISEGRFTEDEMSKDLGIALMVAHACNGIGDYEHQYTAGEWLARVEDSAKCCGEWYYRYSLSLMYCGKPHIALEYLTRGVEVAPEYPLNWLLLGRLRAHFGDVTGANEAVRKGLDIMPEDVRFYHLQQDIDAGRSIEQMELHSFDDDLLFPDVPTETGFLDKDQRRRLEAVRGIVTDRENLKRIRGMLDPEGWIADHPFCTGMINTSEGSVMLVFGMNEAYLSKMDADMIQSIISSIPEMADRARSHMDPEILDTKLKAISIDRSLSIFLDFTYPGENDPITFCFDKDLNIIGDRTDGPFLSFLLIEEDRWDIEAIKNAIFEDWGIRCEAHIEDDSMILQYDDCLISMNLIHSRIPDADVRDCVLNNQQWPEGMDQVLSHKAHIIIAVINHGGSSISAALLHTKLTTSASRVSGTVGIFLDGIVMDPIMYTITSEFMHSNIIPIMNWVWITTNRTEEGLSAYTHGMRLFGFDELECFDTDLEDEDMRLMLLQAAHSILVDGIVVEGSIIMTSDAYGDLEISCSRGVNVDGMSLKVKRVGKSVINQSD